MFKYVFYTFVPLKQHRMFNHILIGFLIGLFVSVPVGPIAVLCMQRTLNKGRRHGFVTGLGAAFSDMVYAIIAVLGIGFVISFIAENQYVIQIIGSIIICIFGVYIYRSNPMNRITPVNSAHNYFQDFGTAFLVTISNPMVVFLFLGLFAKFSFIEDVSVVRSIIGIISVFIGAATWWFLLVSFVNLFRSKINVRRLGIINKVMGIVVIMLAVIAFIVSIKGDTFL